MLEIPIIDAENVKNQLMNVDSCAFHTWKFHGGTDEKRIRIFLSAAFLS